MHRRAMLMHFRLSSLFPSMFLIVCQIPNLFVRRVLIGPSQESRNTWNRLNTNQKTFEIFINMDLNNLFYVPFIWNYRKNMNCLKCVFAVLYKRFENPQRPWGIDQSKDGFYKAVGWRSIDWFTALWVKTQHLIPLISVILYGGHTKSRKTTT